jgi:hypothetical protein
MAGEPEVGEPGSAHIGRLWANEKVLALMQADPEANRADAIALATDRQLVTPVSGAVVLETKQQYDAHNLKPVPKGSVPTVPEPHEWVLILLASAGLMWMIWRHRAQWPEAV